MRRRLLAAGVLSLALAGPAAAVSAVDYESIQAALDANPGELVYVPPGRYEIGRTLFVRTANSGLYGSGTIVQTNRDESIVRIEGDGARVSGVTLTRSESGLGGTQEGIVAVSSRNVVIDGIRVLNNRSKGGAITLRNSNAGTIRNCVVENYKCVTIENRMADPNSGYSFRCLDGTGIVAAGSSGSMITGNRVVEHEFLPTREIRDKYKLGDLTEKQEKPGLLVDQEIWGLNYTRNWHQGSGIIVSALGRSNCTILTDNVVENPAQGFDLHTDNAIVASNIVHHALMGIKAIHGSTHTLIEGNQFIAVDIYGVLLGPGNVSYAARKPADFPDAYTANVDGGTVVANNIVSEFGFGGQEWNWPWDGAAFNVASGPFPENSPVRDVLIRQNIAYDAGRDGIIVDGEPKVVEPHFSYAFYKELEREPLPTNIQVLDNLFHPGLKGIANTDSVK